MIQERIRKSLGRVVSLLTSPSLAVTSPRVIRHTSLPLWSDSAIYQSIVLIVWNKRPLTLLPQRWLGKFRRMKGFFLFSLKFLGVVKYNNNQNPLQHLQDHWLFWFTFLFITVGKEEKLNKIFHCSVFEREKK